MKNKKTNSQETSVEGGKTEERSENRISSSDLVLLDPSEFCDYMKISSKTEYRWRKDQVIPHIRIRGRIYYRLSDIHETLERLKISCSEDNE